MQLFTEQYKYITQYIFVNICQLFFMVSYENHSGKPHCALVVKFFFFIYFVPFIKKNIKQL